MVAITTHGDDEFDPAVAGVGLVGKLGVFVAVTAIAMTATDPVLLAGVLVVSLVFMMATGLKAKALLAAIKPLAPVVILLFVFSGLFFDPRGATLPVARQVLVQLIDTEYFSLSISIGGILFGLGFVAKLLAMMAASIYLIGTTPMEQLLAALQKLRVPNAIGLMMSTAIRFIPTMTSEVATIKDAQRARGAGSKSQKKGRGQAVQGTLPLFVPMIVSSMRRADTMAMSMVSRGYGFTKNRTLLTRLRVNGWDWALIVACAVIVTAFFLLRASRGLGIL